MIYGLSQLSCVLLAYGFTRCAAFSLDEPVDIIPELEEIIRSLPHLLFWSLRPEPEKNP
jgi:hypothetical protein